MYVLIFAGILLLIALIGGLALGHNRWWRTAISVLVVMALLLVLTLVSYSNTVGWDRMLEPLVVGYILALIVSFLVGLGAGRLIYLWRN